MAKGGNKSEDPKSAPKAAPAPKAAKAAVYRVSKGKSITSPRGVLGELSEIKSKDFSSETLADLVKKGSVTKS